MRKNVEMKIMINVHKNGGMMFKILVLPLFAILFMNTSYSETSVPEPSYVLYGDVVSQVKVGGEDKETPVTLAGLRISAKLNGLEIASTELNGTDSKYWLQIPLEANIGQSTGVKARVDETVQIFASGQSSAIHQFKVHSRGEIQQKTLVMEVPVDSDGDGIPDYLESENDRNNPNKPIEFGGAQDIDGDGISNALESLGGDYGEYDQFGDYDGDGFNNNDEYKHEMNPADATSFPINNINLAQYVPINMQAEFNVLQNNNSGAVTDFKWQASWGEVKSAQFIQWSLNGTPDLMVITDQAVNVFILDTNYAVIDHLMPNFSGLDTATTSAHAGYYDFIGDGILELWFHTSNNQLLVYKREANSVKPFGTNPAWITLENIPFGSATEVFDENNDGISDIVYSSELTDAEYAQYGITSGTKHYTLRIKYGTWDNEEKEYATRTSQLFTSRYHTGEPSDINQINNINEVGFDRKPDLIISGFTNSEDLSGWSSEVLLSSQRYQSLVLNVAVADVNSDFDSTADDIPQVAIQAVNEKAQSLGYGSAVSHKLLLADINGDSFMDQLRFIPDSSENSASSFAGKFVIHHGLNNALNNYQDADNDFISDFKDVAPTNGNIPVPNGGTDFDGDGIPYAVDPNNSGSRDTDQDGMSDAFEINFGFDPRTKGSLDGIAGDYDQDGFSDVQEFLNNTNPRESDNPDGRLLTLIKERSVFASSESISDIALKDNLLIAASHHSQKVMILNLNDLNQTVREVEILETANNGISALTIIDDLLYIGTNSGSVFETNLVHENTPILRLKVNHSIVSFDTKGDELYIGDANGTVHYFNSLTPPAIDAIERVVVGSVPISFIEITTDHLVTQMTGTHKEISVLNVSKLQQVEERLFYSINGSNKDAVFAISASNGESLALAQHFESNDIFLMNIANSSSRIVATKPADINVSSLYLNTNEQLYIGYENGVIQQLDTKVNDDLLQVTTNNSAVNKIIQLGEFLVSGHANGQVYVWRIANE